MEDTNRAAWFSTIADMFWQWPEGEPVLAELLTEKRPTYRSPETPDDLAAWLDQYIAFYGHSDKEQKA